MKKKIMIGICFFMLTIFLGIANFTDYIYPNSVESLIETGDNSRRKSEYNLAIKYYSKAIKKNDDPEIKKKLIETYVRNDQKGKALRKVNKYIEESPNNLLFYSLKLDLLEDLKERKLLLMKMFEISYSNKKMRVNVSKELLYDHRIDDLEILRVHLEGFKDDMLIDEILELRSVLGASNNLEKIYSEYRSIPLEFILSISYDKIILNFDDESIDGLSVHTEPTNSSKPRLHLNKNGEFSIGLSHVYYKTLRDIELKCYKDGQYFKSYYLDNFLISTNPTSKEIEEAQYLVLGPGYIETIEHEFNRDNIILISTESVTLDMKELAKFQNLRYLYADPVYIENEDYLSKLNNLETIKLSNYHFDSSNLYGLERLTYLDVEVNEFDVSILDSLTNLNKLKIDAKFLKNKTLNVLSNLNTLNIESTEIDVSSFKLPEKLSELIINSPKIFGIISNDVRRINKLDIETNKLDLDLVSESIANVSTLEIKSESIVNSLPSELSINSLTIDVNEEVSLEMISKINSLRRLDLNATSIVGSELSNCSIKEAIIKVHGSVSLSTFNSCSLLSNLFIVSENVIGKLEGLENLESLYLRTNKEIDTSNISGIKSDKLKEIKFFNLTGKVEDIPNSDALESIIVYNETKLTGDISNLDRFSKLNDLRFYGLNSSLYGKTTLVNGMVIKLDSNSIIKNVNYDRYMFGYSEGVYIKFYDDGNYDITEQYYWGSTNLIKGKYFTTSDRVYCILNQYWNIIPYYTYTYEFDIENRKKLIFDGYMVDSSGKGSTSRPAEYHKR